jgi:Uma2 family endonuclease
MACAAAGPLAFSYGMVEVLDDIELSPKILRPGPALWISDEQLFQLCAQNKELRIERTANGDLVIMSPEGFYSGSGNDELFLLFKLWADKEGSGRAFGASHGFILPNGAMRGPDVSWIRKERLRKFKPEQFQRFLPICPDFVLELRSQSDRLKTLQEKMGEYIENGAKLGWLLNPPRKEVHIYRPNAKPKILTNPKTVSGEPILPEFALDLPRIWAAMESVD